MCVRVCERSPELPLPCTPGRATTWHHTNPQDILQALLFNNFMEIVISAQGVPLLWQGEWTRARGSPRGPGSGLVSHPDMK